MKSYTWFEMHAERVRLDQLEEEIERDLDDLENDRREMNDDMYRRLRKNLLARRRRLVAKRVEHQARIGM